MALFIQMNARRFLGSFREMTSYTDALSVITTLTTSSPWYCIAAFWQCLVLHLLKNHVPLDYPFSCIAGGAHTILVYTGSHTFTDFAGWALAMQFGQESSVSPFPNLVLLSACPWKHREHCDTPLISLVAHGGADMGDSVLLLRKWSTFIYHAAASRWKRPKQIVTQYVELCWNIWDILPGWDSCPETQIYKGGFLSPFLLHSPSTLSYASYPYKHFRRKVF